MSTHSKAVILALGMLSALSLCAPLRTQVAPRTYTYDALGNRVSATNQIRFTTVAGFAIEPRRAVAGEKVNLYGRNFPIGQNSAVTVSFNGTPGVVQSVAERVITVVVPANVTSGPVTLRVQGGPPIPVGDLSVQGVTVSPSVIDVNYDEQRQFTAAVLGGTNPAVVWSVTDLQSGTSNVGTITQSGVYTAPSAGTPLDFAYLVRAMSVQFRVEGHALVRLRCPILGTLGNRTFASGNLAAANELHGWEFMGRGGQYAYAAFLGTNSLTRLTLRSPSGVAVYRSPPGVRLRIPEVLLPEDGTYRIELQGAAAPSGGYRLWLDQHELLPHGVWMFPADGAWHEPTNWSHDRVPVQDQVVVVDDFPGDITLRVEQGAARCYSITTKEGLALLGGTLTVGGKISTSSAVTLDGGALVSSTVVLSGPPMLITSNRANLLSEATIEGDVSLPLSGSQVRIANGLTVNGTAHLSGDASVLLFEGSQTVHAGTIAFEGATGSDRGLQMSTAGTVTLAAGVVVRGGRGSIGTSGAAMTLVNQGTIRADVATQTVTIWTVGFTTSGTLESTNGGRLTVASTWSNAGTILANGGPLDLLGTWSSSGSVTITGATARFGGTWSNAGAVSLNGGALELGGSFRTSGLGTFSNTGGGVYLRGTLDNANSTLLLNGTTGSWYLDGGTISGGAVNIMAPASLEASAANANRLVDVTVNGDLSLRLPGSTLRIANGLTLNGTAHLSGDASVLLFEGSQTVHAGTIAFEGATGSDRGLQMSTAGTVTLAAGVVVRGGRGSIGTSGAAMTLVNQGTIRADVATQTVTIWTVGFTNSGTLESATGALLTVSAPWTNPGTVSGTGGRLDLGGTWSNAGTVQINGGALNLGGTLTTGAGGTFTVTGGGSGSIIGTVNNANSTLLLNGTPGSWSLVGGAILGGTVGPPSTGTLSVANSNSNNRLVGVTVNGDIHLGWLRIAGDLTVNGVVHFGDGGSRLLFEGNQTIRSGTIAFEGMTGNDRELQMFSAGTLTVAPGVVIRGGRGVIGTSGAAMTLVNQGTIRADVATQSVTIGTVGFTNSGTLESATGASLTVNATWSNPGTVSGTGGRLDLFGTWSNAGTVQITGGVLNIGGTSVTFNNQGTLRLAGGTINSPLSIDIQGGILEGAGTVNSNVQNAGTVRPGLNGIGTLVIVGTYTETAAGTLGVDLAGLTQLDRLAISGAATYAGTLSVTLLGGFVPTLGQTFDIATHASTSGAFSACLGCNVGGRTLVPGYNPTNLRLTVQ